MDQMLHRVATKEREEIKRTTKQKMARRHNKEGGNHLDQESNRQKTMADIDGGLHPAVDGQSLGERRKSPSTEKKEQWWFWDQQFRFSTSVYLFILWRLCREQWWFWDQQFRFSTSVYLFILWRLCRSVWCSVGYQWGGHQWRHIGCLKMFNVWLLVYISLSLNSALRYEWELCQPRHIRGLLILMHGFYVFGWLDKFCWWFV